MAYKKDLLLLTIDTKPILKILNFALLAGEQPIDMEDLKRCEDILRNCLTVGVDHANKEGGTTDEILRRLGRSLGN